MGKNLSILKRIRQNEKRKERNLVRKNQIKSARKKIRKLIDASSSKEDLMNAFKEYCSAIDKAAKKNILHKNTAARKKSQMNKLIKDFVLSK